MKSVKNWKKRLLSCGLTVLCMLQTFGCGSGGNAADDIAGLESAALQESVSAGNWAYESETLALALEQNAYYCMKQVGDCLYYAVNEFDEEQGIAVYGINRYSVTDGSIERLPAVLGGSPSRFDIGEDGSLYVVVMCYGVGEAFGQKLEKYDASGERVYSTDVEERLGANNSEETGYLESLLSDSEGRIYLAFGGQVLLFDAQGDYAGNIDVLNGGGNDMVSGVKALGRGKNGKIYAGVLEQAGKGSLMEIDFAKREAHAVMDEFAIGNGDTLQPGFGNDLLINDGAAVYGYDTDNGTREQILTWTDCGLMGNQVTSVGAVSNGKFLVVQNDWAAGTGSILLLTRVSADEKPQKEELVLGAIYSVTVLENAVAEFNKNSDRYHITIHKYYTEGDWNAEAYEDAQTRMKLDIVSGNGPDIIEITSFGDALLEQLAAQGMFEDLTPYLEQSASIGKESFVDNVLETCIYGDVLIGLPKQFTVRTIAGRASDVGGNMGWRPEDLMEIAKRHPGAQVYQYEGKTGLLNLILPYSMDLFVDRKAGKCSFDSPEFISLLEFANSYGDITAPESEDSVQEKCQRGEILLMSVYLDEFAKIQEYEDIFEGEPCMVGYPTADGSAACTIRVNAGCGIAATSAHKEGAWDFVEYFATMENDKYMYAFPALRERMEEQIKEEMEQEGHFRLQTDSNGNYLTDETGNCIPEYQKDENGDPILDENGDPVPQRYSKTVYWGGPDGWSFEYRVISQKDVDRVMEIIRTARVLPPAYTEFSGIISEEAADYFEGAKSADEVAKVIQNRVQLYLHENQ